MFLKIVTKTIISFVQSTTLNNSLYSLIYSARITTGKSIQIMYRKNQLLWLLLSRLEQSITYCGSSKFLLMLIGNLLTSNLLDLLRIFTSIFPKLQRLTLDRSYRSVFMWLMMMEIS